MVALGLTCAELNEKASHSLAVRSALSAAAMGYGAGLLLRRLMYATNLLHARRLPVPVISVGNLTAGGTGKTPFVAWLVRRLGAAGVRPLILSRGHAAFVVQNGQCVNDEFLILRQMAPSTMHIQGKNRHRNALRALATESPDCFVLDDGFQHWQLARDLDIVLIDATNPFGNGHLLPRGVLRETVPALRRAHVVVTTRVDLVEPCRVEQIERKVKAVHPQVVTARTSCQAVRVRALDTKAPVSTASLRGRRAFLVAGIGNPVSFRLLAERLGVDVAGMRVFPDHYAYQASDVERLRAMAQKAGSEYILLTQKDSVKLDMLPVDLAGFWQVEIEVAFEAGEDECMNAVWNVV
ncbi:MAG TPA: tetraacyldisaccharide 4'-kinase, partial [Planctomycetaceae bacterium]|nr:tetraacyldisaccharide 4'-kinase [Planctomycetaceae bacterium]